jgi:hypothetical protein
MKLHLACAGLLFAAMASCVIGQTTIDRLATGSPHGIYVLLGAKIASRQHPVGTVCGYLLERHKLGESDWRAVAHVEAPVSFEEFKQRFDVALELIPGQTAPTDSVLRFVFDRAQRFGRVESLRQWGNVMPVRIAFGLTYLDEQPDKNLDYEYRVSEFDAARKTTLTLISGAARWPKPVDFPRPRLLQKQGTKKGINMRWCAVGERRQANFLVYRRDDIAGEFQLVKPQRIATESKDTVFYVVRDTLVTPFHIYDYYLVPVCQYGNTGVTSETLRMPTYSFKDVPLPDSIKVASRDSQPGLKLTWRLREPQAVESVRVYRCERYMGDYVLLATLPPEQTVYNDESAEEMIRYFYRFEISGLLGEKSGRSAAAFWFYRNPYQPDAALNLAGEGTEKGVRLQWEWAVRKPAGFYVYRCAGSGDTMNRVSSLIAADETTVVFLDTTPDLSPYTSYGYSVQAESKSRVLGPFSETVYVRPAKPTHPQAPFDIESRWRDGAVRMYWADMRPIVRELAGYLVYRRELGQDGPLGDFAPLSPDPLDAKAGCVVDTAVVPNKRYEYAMRCIDAFGGQSELSLPVTVDITMPPPVAPAGVRATAAGNAVLVQWDETMQPNLASYRLYREESGQSPKALGDFKPDQFEFSDSGVRPGALYIYYLTSLDKYGTESRPGEEVTVRF